MNIVSLIVGICLILVCAIIEIVCIIRTPENLREWYGIMFTLCSLGGIIGGVFLILIGCNVL